MEGAHQCHIYKVTAWIGMWGVLLLWDADKSRQIVAFRWSEGPLQELPWGQRLGL